MVFDGNKCDVLDYIYIHLMGFFVTILSKKVVCIFLYIKKRTVVEMAHCNIPCVLNVDVKQNPLIWK